MTAVADGTVSPSSRTARRGVRRVVTGLALLAVLGGALLPWLRQRQNEQAERAAAAGIMCSPEMRPIPGGSFMFGDRVEMTVAGFCLDVTEVTLAAYRECVGAGACSAPGASDGPCNWHDPSRSRHPVNCVTWQDAARYCAWARKSLPSEAQWEYAARGGFRELEYPWGDAPPSSGSACWSPRGERTGTCPVASFPATAFGLHDMAGNVSEWVGARVDDAQARRGTPPTGTRCTRGGSWMVGDPMLLHPVISTERFEGENHGNLGFRCAAAHTVAPTQR